MAALACPRGLCTTLTLAPALSTSDAVVCLRSCGTSPSMPTSLHALSNAQRYSPSGRNPPFRLGKTSAFGSAGSSASSFFQRCRHWHVTIPLRLGRRLHDALAGDRGRGRAHRHDPVPHMPAPECNDFAEARPAVAQNQRQSLEPISCLGEHQQLCMTQVAPLTFGLFRKIFVPLDLERDVLRNLASPLALLEDSTYRRRARVSRLADRPAPRCPPWTGQRPQSCRIGLVARPFQRNVFPLRQHHRVKQRAIACNGLRLSMLVGGEPLLGDRAGRFGTLAGIDILAALNVRSESVQAGLCIRACAGSCWCARIQWRQPT